jgi:predicted hydrocarbon binding protein
VAVNLENPYTNQRCIWQARSMQKNQVSAGQLMSSAEKQQSVARPDDSIFASGLPGIVAFIMQKTWAPPVLALSRTLGSRAETLFEPGARFIGSVLGRVLRPVLGSFHQSESHILEDTLIATRIAENLTGIEGVDYYVNEKKAVRQVHTCPFKNQPGATLICHLGEAAGQEIFTQLVPGVRHKVHVTMARGHGFCEYSYEVD